MFDYILYNLIFRCVLNSGRNRFTVLLYTRCKVNIDRCVTHKGGHDSEKSVDWSDTDTLYLGKVSVKR